MILSLRQRVGIGFGTLAAAVLAIGVGSYRTTASFMENASWVSHTHQVLETLERVRSLMDEAESSQRGYLLTGEERFRNTFDSAVSLVPERLKRLKDLTADNPTQQQRLEALEILVKVLVMFAQDSFTVHQASGFQAAQDLASVTRREQDAAAMRRLVQEMKEEERKLLTQRLSRTEAAGQGLLDLILGGGLLAAILVGLVVYGIRSDVIGRRRAEESLEASRARQAIIVESLPIVLYAAVPRGPYEATWISQSAERLTGFPLSKFLTDSTFRASRLHPEDREATLRMFDGLTASGSLAVEYRWQVSDGSYRWFSDRALLVRGSNGQPKEIFGLWEDVTERKRLTDALHESKEALEAVFRASPLAVTAVSADGDVVIWNKAAERLFGWMEEEVLGRPLPTLPPDRVNEHRAFRERVLRGETFTGQDVRRRRKDGLLIDVSLSAAPLRHVDGTVWGAMGVLMDITDRKRAERELRLQAQIIDQTHDAVVLIGADGRVRSWNPGAERVFGCSAADAVGRPLSSVCGGVTETALAKDVVPALTAGRVATTEGWLRTRSGQDRYVHFSWSPLDDETGALTGLICLALDITARWQAEADLTASREQLRALAARLESIREEERTRIAREVHDELGQVLTGLKLDMMWLSKRLDDNGQPVDRRALLEKLNSSSMLLDGMHETVRQIATELRPGVLDELGLPAACEWQANEFQARTGIRCDLTIVPNDLTVDMNRATALFRILQELLTNVASHAHATEVRLTLERSPDYLCLEVRDNGRGITEAEQSSLRSLGLLGIRERACQFDGEVIISGNAGKGTTVIVRFPCFADLQ